MRLTCVLEVIIVGTPMCIFNCWCAENFLYCHLSQQTCGWLLLLSLSTTSLLRQHDFSLTNVCSVVCIHIAFNTLFLILQGYFKVLGKGNIPRKPMIVKARFFSRLAEKKIKGAGGACVLMAWGIIIWHYKYMYFCKLKKKNDFRIIVVFNSSSA